MNIILHTFPKGLYRFFCITTFLFSIPLISISQPVFQWDRTYGGNGWEELQSIRPLPNGDIIMGGSTFSDISGDVSDAPCDSFQKGDFWLVRTDLYGNPLWNRRYGGNGLDRIWSVLPTRDGGFLLGGDSNSDASCLKSEAGRGGDDFWLIKTDSAGNPIWEKTYGSAGDDELHDLYELPDGSFFVLGFSDSLGGGDKTAPLHGSYDFWLLKLKPDGEKIWDHTYGGRGWEQAYVIEKTPEGDFLLGGFSTSHAHTGNKTDSLYGLNDFWVVKIDTSGKVLWDRTYGGASEDVLLDIERSNDGGYLLGGQSRSLDDGNKKSKNKGLRDYWVVKIDPEGNKLWDKSYGGPGYDDGFALHQNEDGNILVGGVSSSNAGADKSENCRGGNDFWLIFLDANGRLIWDLTFGGDNIDALTKIFPVADGGIILGGHSSSTVSGDKTQNNQGLNDFWLVKTACRLKLDLGNDTLVCKRTPVIIEARQPNCLDCKYYWSDGSEEPNRVLTPPVTKKYGLYITSKSGCELRDSIQINILDSPDEIFAQVNPPKCPGEYTGSIIVQSIEGGTPQFVYSLGGNYYDDRGAYYQLAPGNYTLHVEDANGCTLDSLIQLNEPAPLEVKIFGGGKFELGDSTTLVPVFSEAVDTFFWNFSNSLSCTNCLTPVAKPLETTTYLLTAFNESGCKIRENVVVAIEKKRPVFFPTAFSPNNDGDNDFYRFYGGKSVRHIHKFQIYDRWGELMFAADNWDPNEHQYSWDGFFRGGEMPVGAYVYFAEIEFIDGWKEFYEGSFSLIR